MVIKSFLVLYFREELGQDIGESPYSLYWDKTTDIAVNKLLCICVKYCSKKHNRFVSTYLGLIKLLEDDANKIVDAIIGFLQANELNITNMVGIVKDGASVISFCVYASQTKQPNQICMPYQLTFSQPSLWGHSLCSMVSLQYLELSLFLISLIGYHSRSDLAVVLLTMRATPFEITTLR